MEVLTTATLIALVVKALSALKFITTGDVRQFITQILSWLLGFLILLIAAQADVAQHLVLWGDQRLGDMDVWSLFLAGLAIASTGSFAYDVKKALDGSDTASEPSLPLPSPRPPSP